MEENTAVKYPRFLAKEPSGEDLFEGKSQETIASCIVEQIRNEDTNHRMMGIEGSWGSGKSNLLKLIENKLENCEKKTYQIFLYDVWGHQEDLQRKSILEEMVTFLENKVSKLSDLRKKVRELTGTIRETTTTSVPKLSVGICLTFILFFIFPVFEIVSNTVENFCIKILIILSPIGILLLYFIGELGYVFFKKDKRLPKTGVFATALHRMISVYKDKEIEKMDTEFIHEQNPSVPEFRNFMEDISKVLVDKNQKLIIVFDNMDRLPIEKVRDLWSSIHTFFSEKQYKNIFTIVTFDRNHIRDAFKDTINGDKGIGDDFINKTFGIVYRVPLPILTDWKSFFRCMWENAFGDSVSEEEIQRIIQIYDAQLSISDFTPRQIIGFINEIVSLKLVLPYQIPERYMGLFVAAKTELLDKPFSSIIRKEYLGSLKYIYQYDPELDKYMASLVYQIDPEQALSVAYTKRLADAFNNFDKTSLRDLKDVAFIFEILDDAISQVHNFENLILSLDFINDIFTEKQSVYKKIWTDMYHIVLAPENKLTISENNLLSYQEKLLKHLDDKSKKNYTKNLIRKLEEKEKFIPADYFSIVQALKNHGIGEDFIKQTVSEKRVTVEDYIDFIKVAKNENGLVKVSCNITDLDNHLANLQIQDIVKTNYLQYVPERLKLENFRKKLEPMLGQQVNNIVNFTSVLHLLKHITEGVVNISSIPKSSTIDSLFVSAKEDFKYDIVAIAIAMNYISGGNIVNFLNVKDEDNISNLASVLEYYITFGDVLDRLKTVSQYPIYCDCCKQLIIEGSKKSVVNNISALLSQFKQICEKTGVDYESLFVCLSKWGSFFNPKDSDIPQTLALEVLQAAVVVKEKQISKNDAQTFASKCIKIVTDYLSKFTQEQWIECFKTLSNYGVKEALAIQFQWNATSKEAVKNIVLQISNGKIVQTPANKETWSEMLEIIEEKTVFWKNLRDGFCNATYTMDKQKLVFLGKYLFEYGQLEENLSSLRTIIPMNLLEDDDVASLLVEYEDKFIKLLKAETNEAKEYRNEIRNIVLNNQDSKLSVIAYKIKEYDKKDNETDTSGE